MVKIDKRKHYYMVLDTETANNFINEDGKLDTYNSLVYDIGLAIVDKQGAVFETRSFVIYEVFVKERELMKSAYYAEKIPKYWDDIKDGTRKLITLAHAKNEIHALCKKYHIKAIVAHNAGFDVRALNTTERYITKSKYRYFLPRGIPIWDTQKMARDTICKQKLYKSFCEKYGLMTTHKTPRVRESAEAIYKYLTCNPNFVEEHRGLDDVLIEKEIFAKALRQHKPMRKKLYA